MKRSFLRWCGLAVLLGTALSAHPGIPESFLDIEVLDATAPPGGAAQIVIQLTEPKPITTGRFVMRLSSSLSLAGIYLSSPNGDVAGAATLAGDRLVIRFASPAADYGMGTAYAPIAVITLKVDAGVAPGTQIPVVLDDRQSVWNDPSGAPWAVAIRQGTITVAGTVGITDVRPAGNVKAGQAVDIYGLGFQPGAAVICPGIDLASVEYVSPDHMSIQPLADASFDEQVVQVVNPDLTAASYIAYERPTYHRSKKPKLAATDAVFPDQVFSTADFGPLASGLIDGVTYSAGLAIGNPVDNPVKDEAEVEIEAFDSTGVSLGAGVLELKRGHASLLEVSEIVGKALAQSDIYLRVTSEAPVKMVAMQGDDQTDGFTPLGPLAVPLPYSTSIRNSPRAGAVGPVR
jgi:hypothetical protein